MSLLQDHLTIKGLKLYRSILLLLSLTLFACQSTNDQLNTSLTNVSIKNLLIDGAFPTYQQVKIETAQELFELDDDIQQIVEEQILPIPNKTRRAKKLLRLIFINKNQGMDYLSSANITASEAFHSKTANCLSLTILAYSLAKKSNLEIRFQEVEIPEFWTRNGQYSLLTGHVNLSIVQAKYKQSVLFYGSKSLQIDFDPYTTKNHFPRHVIKKSKVISMFYNNKAAQAIVDKKYDVAYAYLKSAITILPNYSNTWGNLGLLYRLTNQFDLAENTYLHALALNNNNLTALSNLAILFKMKGNNNASEIIQRKIENKRKNNPYYYAMKGDEAVFANNLPKALGFYKKAIRLNRNIHEIYFSLAKVYFRMNETVKAENAINRAIKLNKLTDIDDQYIAKLNLIKSTELPH